MSTELDHLLDRAGRNVLLVAEADRLRELVGELEKENATLRDWLAHCRHKPRVTELEAEVARLTAGQCLDSRRMCEQHHTPPVTGCPYPQCIAARKQQECVHTGANAEDCPACPGPPTA